VARGQSVPCSVKVVSVLIERRSHNSGQNGHVHEVGDGFEVMRVVQQLTCHFRESAVAASVAGVEPLCARTTASLSFDVICAVRDAVCHVSSAGDAACRRCVELWHGT
jgi:hypothetical protein